MSPVDVVTDLYGTVFGEGEFALATVIGVEGSSYRREGAHLIVHDDGGHSGTISGGCLEDDAADVGVRALRQARPLILRYDLDDDTVFGLGIGCPGTVDILVEPVRWQGGHDEVLLTFCREMAERRPVTLVRRLLREGDDVQRVDRLVVGRDLAGTLGDGLDGGAVEAARDALADIAPASGWVEVDGEKLFLDVVVPPVNLVIFGAGDDAVPLSAMAQAMGLPVEVVDVRTELLTKGRFPGARLVHARGREAFGREIPVGPRTAIVAMNHQIERDREALAFALPSAAFYVGLLGPRTRGEKTLEALGAEFAEAADRLMNPIGLDIGAESPAEIAVAILAEIVARREGRRGGFLKERIEPMHPAHQTTGRDLG